MRTAAIPAFFILLIGETAVMGKGMTETAGKEAMLARNRVSWDSSLWV